MWNAGDEGDEGGGKTRGEMDKWEAAGIGSTWPNLLLIRAA